MLRALKLCTLLEKLNPVSDWAATGLNCQEQMRGVPLTQVTELVSALKQMGGSHQAETQDNKGEVMLIQKQQTGGQSKPSR